jgi:TPP-dependent 2-oxoacid decarboxylase
MTATYTVGDYLLDRLAELGVDRIFGVPGDFTLGFLDKVEDDDRIEWVGMANELGAGYAADGYARVRGLGVVCTTFGVGELSAINAIAGSFAEYVPVLNLVGAPSTLVQKAGRATHHTLGDGDFEHTVRIAAEVTVAHAMPTAAEATAEIDRVLTAIVRAGQPGHLCLATDVSAAPAEPPTTALPVGPAISDSAALSAFRDAAAALLETAGRPVVLADILVDRCHAQDALRRFLAETDLPFASLLWGRRVIDESHPNHLGTYIAAAGDAAVRERVESAPAIITAGVHFTDLTSGFFTQRLPEARIDLLPHTASVGEEVFAGVEMRDALSVLGKILRTADRVPSGLVPPVLDAATTDPTGPLTQQQLWAALTAHLRAGDLVFADQGTSFYGMGAQDLPRDVAFLGQPLWASIGYTLPAALGGALAAPEKRTILLIGDGAAQLTIQELGTIIRLGTPMIVVVVNNDGYTVERAIHGPERRYNDIAGWNWTALPAALGADPARVTAMRVETRTALEEALESAAAGGLTFIEAVTDRLDIPPLLSAIAAAAASANARKN